MDNIGKDKVLSAVVRTFFKYFVLGIIEANADDPSDMSVYEPKSVKKFVVKHFEDISRIFNQEAFYAISRMNYIEEELEKELTAFVSANNPSDAVSMMRFACRTEEFYSAMVSEYKRNMEALLCGVFAGEEAEGYSSCKEIGDMEVELAESIVNRIANKAYEEGKKLS